MDMRPIGVFDSGLGGLTAVRELQQLLPAENLIYFGDTARVPYGMRTQEELVDFCRQDVRFLRSFDLKAVLIACGTATTAALPVLQAENDLPIVGVVEPAVRRALAASKNKKIGLIATFASVRSGAYEAKLRQLDDTAEMVSLACPKFVPLIESGHFLPGDEAIESVAREYLEPMKETGIDTLILGCTHYPLLTEIVAGIMGPEVTLISAGGESAYEVKRLLEEREMLNQSRRRGETKFFVSGDVEEFSRNGSTFLQEDLQGRVGRIDIEQY